MTDLLSTVQAAALARRAPGTVRAWASRGLLTPAQRTPRGDPLYTVQAVWDAERTACTRDLTTRSAEAVATR